MSYAGAATSALSGAAAGSVLGPWGTAAGAGLGLVSGLMAGDGGAGAQRQLSQNQLQNALNQQQYSQALNAEALRRSTAGSTDGQGNTIRYDPGSNSWVSTLGNVPAKVQASQDQATLLRNNRDIPLANASNIAQAISASTARRGLSGAENALNSYTPTTTAGLEGALQDATTRANQVSEAPVIADTLRQFARTGTAAGPVLAQLQRSNANTLAQQMDQNVIQARTAAPQINQQNRAALTVPIQALQAAGTPNFSMPQVAGDSPAAQLAAQVNGRVAGSTQPATQGAAYNAYNTSASNQASNAAIGTATNDPAQAQLAAAEKAFTSGSDSNPSAAKQLGSLVNGWFGSNAPDNGAQPQRYSSSGALITDPKFNPYTGQAYQQQDGVS